MATATGGLNHQQLKIRLIAVGQRQPAWLRDAYLEFAKRLPKTDAISVIEVPSQGRKTGSVDKILGLEADKILAHVDRDDWLVVLDERGDNWSTVELSKRMASWAELGRSVVMLIGGADGLHSRCLERANETLALSRGTYPHGLVRVMLAEQLYRAWSLANGHPYHRT